MPAPAQALYEECPRRTSDVRGECATIDDLTRCQPALRGTLAAQGLDKGLTSVRNLPGDERHPSAGERRTVTSGTKTTARAAGAEDTAAISPAEDSATTVAKKNVTKPAAKTAAKTAPAKPAAKGTAKTAAKAPAAMAVPGAKAAAKPTKARTTKSGDADADVDV